ncbi:MAG TPA: hypothetical protein PLD20_08085 [Blastocatellia bacterium]|nr:hypothetical protein [Blastocatellia bacterium]HMV85039.1 hypothetical protein [Blastocatellia bacterium]HMX28511.1 hypothetical protein [Blastocatellia bacterium]HMY73463.1 hypothetical protein [Blastocatellia bacterium]HMZ17872.1 hypothetical protein [Blastocatellia bacterium]
MRNRFLMVFLVAIIAVAELLNGDATQGAAQDVAAKAQQLLTQARAALGGDKLKSLTSLSASGSIRRKIGQMEMSGELQLDMLLPDKVMRVEVTNLMGAAELTRMEVLNGTNVWTDQQTSGGGGMMMIRRPGGDNPHAQAQQQNAVRAEMARTMIGWLLTTPSSFPVEYKFAGEAESPDGKADVLEVKGANDFAVRLFLDQKSHKPLLLTYKGRKPRVVMSTGSAPSSEEELKKQIADAEAKAASEPLSEYQVTFNDYRDVNGVSLPHRLTKSIDNEVNEEWEISKFKLNPQLKPEKFEKKQ